MVQCKRMSGLQAHSPEFKCTASTQKPNMAVHAYNPSTGEWRQVDPWNSLLADAASDSVRDPASKSKVAEEDM